MAIHVLRIGQRPAKWKVAQADSRDVSPTQTG
jgi:hypothetical protein